MVDPVRGQMLPRNVEMWSRGLTQQERGPSGKVGVTPASSRDMTVVLYVGLGLSFRMMAVTDSELECSCYLLLGKEVLDQGAHDLLRGPRCAEVRDKEAPVRLLRIADPA